MSDPLVGRRQELLDRVVARGETIRRHRRAKFTAIAAGSTAMVVLVVATALAQRDLDPREVAPIASGEQTATPSPTPEPAPTATPAPAAADTATPAPTAVPDCSSSDFEASLVADSKTHRLGERFNFVATARNVSTHDCIGARGFAYQIRGPKPSDEVVSAWPVHGDFIAGQGPSPWSPGAEERSEFEWDTKDRQQHGYPPPEPGEYVVTASFSRSCDSPCAVSASTTVTVLPASTPSPSPSPAPLT